MNSFTDPYFAAHFSVLNSFFGKLGPWEDFQLVLNEFPTIKDKNIICTARLLFETPGPACRDTAARWCVSRHGVWSIQPFSQEIEIVASLQICNLPHKGLNAALVKHVLVSLSRRFISFLLSLASLSKSIDWLDFCRVFPISTFHTALDSVSNKETSRVLLSIYTSPAHILQRSLICILKRRKRLGAQID